jgi:hypothetical protein
MTDLGRATGSELRAINRRLADRERDSLRSLLTCRYMTTRQIQRLHITNSPSKKAAITAAQRMLLKLKNYGLVEHLERRIGGVRAGSGSYVWVLTDTGFRILHIGCTGNQSRKRLYEPSPVFLEHTLAIAETYLQLTEICNSNKMELTQIEFEPKCWRGYIDTDSRPATLKPDLFAVTASGEYEDCWFFEVDLATESPNKIIEKCQRYAHYYHSGAEQRKTGVFPFVVWIVPNQYRKNSLIKNISECRDLHPKSLFTVITPEQLNTLITQDNKINQFIKD